MSGDDIALDFMTEHEVAEILATEELLGVDMNNLEDDLLMVHMLDLLMEKVATDSDTE